MEGTKHLLSTLRQAIDTYGMIAEGDRIAVGVSGGKDSIVLLALLAELRRFYPASFSLTAITVDPGFPTPQDVSPLCEFAERLGVEFRFVKTDIYRIVFEERREPNPCSLCSRMRRGALVNEAEAIGCNKLALGHHLDDVGDTLLMNLFFEGRVGCFSPVTALENRAVTVIRPLIFTHESAIRQFAVRNGMPVLPSACPEDKQTERAEIHRLADRLEKSHRGIRHRLLTALQKGHIDGY